MQTTQDLAAGLSRLLGLRLQPDEHAACAMRFDDDVHVEARVDGAQDLVALCAAVGNVPEHGRSAIHRIALRANLVPEAMGGAHFALQPESGDLLLCMAMPAGPQAEADAVLDAIGRMVTLCRQCVRCWPITDCRRSERHPALSFFFCNLEFFDDHRFRSCSISRHSRHAWHPSGGACSTLVQQSGRQHQQVFQRAFQLARSAAGTANCADATAGGSGPAQAGP